MPLILLFKDFLFLIISIKIKDSSIHGLIPSYSRVFERKVLFFLGYLELPKLGFSPRLKIWKIKMVIEKSWNSHGT